MAATEKPAADVLSADQTVPRAVRSPAHVGAAPRPAETRLADVVGSPASTTWAPVAVAMGRRPKAVAVQRVARTVMTSPAVAAQGARRLIPTATPETGE